MKINSNLVFWGTVWLLLTLLFSTSLNSFLISFYFVTILLPAVLGTSIFFNRFLVPKYLLPGKRSQFVLYFLYMIVVSIYLELVIMILAFVVLADYEIKNLGNIAGDIYLMTLILYLIVLVEGMVLSVKKMKFYEIEMNQLKGQLERDKNQSIEIKVDRKNIILSISKISYIESLSDYVQIRADGKNYITKEKISKLEEKLPSFFLRIHRSFLINKNCIESYNREEILIGEKALPVGRKYRKEIMENLKSSTL